MWILPTALPIRKHCSATLFSICHVTRKYPKLMWCEKSELFHTFDFWCLLFLHILPFVQNPLFSHFVRPYAAWWSNEPHEIFLSHVSKSTCEKGCMKMRSGPSKCTQSLGNSHLTMNWKQETGFEVCQQSSEVTSLVCQGHTCSYENQNTFRKFLLFTC